MPLADCLQAAAECDAPMISICGGEPLIYPEIEALTNGLLEQGRIVYICTNGTRMRQKMREYLLAEVSRGNRQAAAQARELVAMGLITEVQCRSICAGEGNGSRQVIAPSGWVYWNVHLDGMEKTHDAIVERAGVFQECVQAIRMAKFLGYQVATNTTVYRETDMTEIEQLFVMLGGLGVDGHTISPGYDYDAAKRDMMARLGRDPDAFFLTRHATWAKFARAVEWGSEYPILGTPLYLEFLAGKRELPCSAWAIPTRNVKGWKGPCYLMTDAHHRSYADLLSRTDWPKYGRDGNSARDPRCANCMVHCGFEPSASLGIDALPGDTWKTVRFNFGQKPDASKKAIPVQ